MRARPEHLPLEAGEEPLELAAPARQERVHVAPLRHACPLGRTLGKGVAVDDRDPVEVVCQHAGRAQAGDAAPDHHCTLGRHRGSPSLRRAQTISTSERG